MTDLCYYRCYPKDYLGSPIISRMTLEEQGAHQRLIAHGWRMNGIPADRREIATLLGLEPGSERAERIITRVVDLAWKPDPDQPRTLRNDEQEAERRQVEGAYRKRCESAAGARQRKAEKGKSLIPELKPELKPELVPALESRIQNPEEALPAGARKKRLKSQKPAIEREDLKERFLFTWSAYPKKPGLSRENAARAWHARIQEGESPEVLHTGTVGYAAFVKYRAAMDPTWKPDFIKAADVFFGPGKHYLSDWSVPAPPEPYLPNNELNPAYAAALGLPVPR